MSNYQANQIKKKLVPFMTLLLAVACMGLLASCGGGGTSAVIIKDEYISPQPVNETFVTNDGHYAAKGQILAIRLDSKTHQDVITWVANNAGWEVIGYIPEMRSYQIAIATDSVDNAQLKIKGSGLFSSSMENLIYEFNSTDDALYKGLYDAKNYWAQKSIFADEARLLLQNSTPLKVNIGIIDGGFRYDHEDLSIEEIYKLNTIKVSAIEPSPSCALIGTDLCDAANHGMHVAGIIGAIGNNIKGISGVAHGNTKIYAYQTSLSTMDVQSGIKLLIGKQVKVINMSIGLKNKCSKDNNNCQEMFTMERLRDRKKYYIDALREISGQDVLFIQSSGNSGKSKSSNGDRAYSDFNGWISSIASSQVTLDAADETIANKIKEKSLIVGAYKLDTTFRNELIVSDYTQLPYSANDLKYPFIVAPGGWASDLTGDLLDPTLDVVSTTYEKTTSYAHKGGTSMATPHVTGVAALVWQAKSTLTAAEVRDIILTNTNTVDGYRALNAEKAVQAALATLPQPPIITSPLYDRYTGDAGEACYSRQIGTQKSAGVYTLSNSQYCRRGGQWVNVTGTDNERFLDSQGNLYPFSAVEIKDTGNNTYTAGYGGSTIWNVSYTQKSTGTYSETVRTVSDHYSVDFNPNSYIFNNVEEFAILLYRYNTSSTNTGYLSSGGTTGFLFEGPSTTSGSVKYFNINDPNRSAINTGAWTRKSMGANAEIIELDEKSTLLNSYPDSSLRKIYYRGSSAGVREGNKTLAGRVDSSDLLDRNTFNAILVQEGLPVTPN